MMAEPPSPDADEEVQHFKQEATRPPRRLLHEFWGLFGQNKKWWLLPIVLALLVASALIILGGTSIAPLIYTLF